MSPDIPESQGYMGISRSKRSEFICRYSQNVPRSQISVEYAKYPTYQVESQGNRAAKKTENDVRELR
eukprot:1315831-Amorphochlora_amoeboformis.AAC.1